MSTQMKEKCPLCLEEMDLTDKQLKPCNCGYEMCLWCWHHIMEMDRKDECGGRCPGCRSFYDKDRILGSSISNQILMEICADKSKLQKEQYNSHKQRLPKLESRVVDEPKDPTAVRVIQRKLVYIVGMPSEFASEKILRQKKFLGQYGKIENIIIDNIGANQHVPDSGRVYVTFSREEEAIRCIQAVNGYILDGRPLKATFGVTRYCHIWLSNKICRKPNCSYVHHKVPQEDICSKDDVALVCARLQHLLGMDLKDPQQRSGTTLPSPGDSSGRTTMNSGKSKDNCYANDARVLANGGSNNSGVLPVATLWDSNLPSNSPSSAVYTILQRRNDHSCINNHSTSDAKSQASALGGYNCSSIKEVTASVKHMQLSNEATEGISLQRSKNINVALQEPNDRFTEQLASGDGASAALLGNDASKPNKMTSTENEMTYTTLLQKSQNVDLVAQGPHDRFTKQLASGDGKPKASGQVGNDSSKSKRITVSENEPHDSITLPRYQNINVVSQRSKDLYHMLTNKLASAIVKCQTEAQERVGCLSIKDKSLSVTHMQLLEGIAVPASHSTSASQNLSDSASMLSNHLTSTHLKLHASAGSEEFPNLEENLMSGNHLQLSCQEKSDDKYQTSEQGGFCSLYNREMDVSANHVQISDQLTESVLSSRSHSLNPYTKKMAQDSKESDLNNITISSVASESSPLMPRDAQSHGIGHPSDSDKFAPVCASAYSMLCSTPDGSTSDSCYISDPSDIISWVSECLEDDVDAAEPSNCVGLSCPFGASTIQRSMQFPGSLVSGASNQCVLSPYPSGLQCIGGIESTICYCDVPFSSNAANEKPEHLNRTGNSYASTGVCDAFSQHPTSNVKAARVVTVLQSSPPQSIYNDWTNGNANSSLTNPPVDFSYRMYSLF